MKKEKSIEILVDSSEHWYKSPKKKNVYYPSCTTILSVYPKSIGFNRYLTEQLSWESAEKKLEEASERGTHVHLGAELLEMGQELHFENYQQEEWLRLIGFVNWWKEYQPKLIASEVKLVSDNLKIGGTADRIYEIDGKVGVVDIKTGKRTYNNYWVQVAAYEKLVSQKKVFPKIDFIAILRLTPLRKDHYEYMEMTDWKETWKTFKACQQTWWFENGRDAQPKILTLPKELKLDITPTSAKVEFKRKFNRR